MMFRKMTQPSGQAVFVNPDAIAAIRPLSVCDCNEVLINLTNGGIITLSVPFDEAVKALRIEVEESGAES